MDNDQAAALAKQAEGALLDLVLSAQSLFQAIRDATGKDGATGATGEALKEAKLQYVERTRAFQRTMLALFGTLDYTKKATFAEPVYEKDIEALVQRRSALREELYQKNLVLKGMIERLQQIKIVLNAFLSPNELLSLGASAAPT